MLESELLANPRRLTLLLAYYRSEGWGDDRDDLRTGHQTKMLLQALRGATGSAEAWGAYLQCDKPTAEQIRERDGKVLEGLAACSGRETKGAR